MNPDRSSWLARLARCRNRIAMASLLQAAVLALTTGPAFAGADVAAPSPSARSAPVAAGRGAALAAASDHPAAATEGGVAMISSCIEGSPPLALAAGDSHALLDSEDRELFQAAALLRFPVLDRDGFEAVQIMLWGKGDDAWIYVTLQSAPLALAQSNATGAAAPDAAAAPCFTAVFTGAAFEFTPELVRKYFKGQVRI